MIDNSEHWPPVGPRTRLTAAGCFALAFCLVYGSADLLARLVPYRLHLPYLPWPFYPQLSALYLSIDLMLLWLFLRLPAEQIARFFVALCTQLVWAWPIFVLLPVAAPPGISHDSSTMFRLADLINLDNNYFPSLHVAFAVTCALFGQSVLMALWAAAISVSTLLTHQHYLIDVVGGVVLAYLAFRESRSLSAWCRGELLRTSFRHRRYAVIGMALVALNFYSPRRGKRAMLGFCYLQHLDDLLDGHLASAEDPEKLARKHLDSWKGREFGPAPADRAGAKLRDLGAPTNLMTALVEEMLLDHVRARDSILLEESQLLAHLHRTFALSLDLMLWAADSPLTAEQLPNLTALLGWCSLYRDFEEDTSLGLFNVPAHLDSPEGLSAWLLGQTKLARESFDLARAELTAVAGLRGHFLLKIFHKSTGKYLYAAQPEELDRLSRMGFSASAGRRL